LVQAVTPALSGAYEKIKQLQKPSVFDGSVLTNAVNLESEIRKRAASQQIIEEARESVRRAIEGFRQNVASRAVSGGDKDGVIESVEQEIRNQSPRWQEKFDLLQRRERADLDFLRFMGSIQGDYELKDGKILFDCSVAAWHTRRRGFAFAVAFRPLRRCAGSRPER